MQKITFEQVRKTYNGRTGCACGCLGRYTLPSHASIEEANAKTGYNAYGEDDVSDRRCKIALTKINKAIEQYGHLAEPNACGGVEYSAPGIWFCYSESFVGLDMHGRATTVYF